MMTDEFEHVNWFVYLRSKFYYDAGCTDDVKVRLAIDTAIVVKLANRTQQMSLADCAVKNRNGVWLDTTIYATELIQYYTFAEGLSDTDERTVMYSRLKLFAILQLTEELQIQAIMLCMESPERFLQNEYRLRKSNLCRIIQQIHGAINESSSIRLHAVTLCGPAAPALRQWHQRYLNYLFKIITNPYTATMTSRQRYTCPV